MQTTLTVLVLALIVVWFYWRQRKAQQIANAARSRSKDRRVGDSGTQYHAVAIRFSHTACDSAKKLEGQRFLAAAAPQLPLPGCDRDRCDCRFQHYDDRRCGRERRSPFSSGGLAASTGKYEQERRQGDDRRTPDQNE